MKRAPTRSPFLSEEALDWMRPRLPVGTTWEMWSSCVSTGKHWLDLTAQDPVALKLRILRPGLPPAEFHDTMPFGYVGGDGERERWNQLANKALASITGN